MGKGTGDARGPGRAGRVVTLAAAAAVALAATTGCGRASTAPDAASPPPSAAGAATPSPGATTASSTPSGPPRPDAAIPQDPRKLARALDRTTRAMRAAIGSWTKDGDPGHGRPPEDVVLLTLYHQRLCRYAARHPDTAERAFAELTPSVAAQARDDATAVRELLSLAHPVTGKVSFKLREPLPADVLLGHFKKAGRRFGVEWEVLAAVMLVETKFGRVRSASSAGAQGPMQFMPATWRAYGMGGDIHDTGDAVAAAANYLRASGAPGDYRKALHAYNHSQAYVDAVLLHARAMKRDVRAYYAYYNWQVFVLVPGGERRLTGPGLA
ncbi:lytic murein transglycosylase [Sphaerisporangium sp. NPDC005289]|uniref:lytic transglycosylase domain-containing protein n=1 Tax=Sphaerisporangium sp. NPDC005289 TaxID=3155247 RepID=UPI0033AF0D91